MDDVENIVDAIDSLIVARIHQLTLGVGSPGKDTAEFHAEKAKQRIRFEIERLVGRDLA